MSGDLGQIIILNGAPRSGKSSIAKVIQETFEGVWINMGVDSYMSMTPDRYQPGIGLRPGGERPDLEPMIVNMYQALYEAIAAHSRLHIHVVVDVGHHDNYSVPRDILAKCARILRGLPVLFVGVHCPIDTIMSRRMKTWQTGYTESGAIPMPVKRWQDEVHQPGVYDMEVDTSKNTPEECAAFIHNYLTNDPRMSAMKVIGKETKS